MMHRHLQTMNKDILQFNLLLPIFIISMFLFLGAIIYFFNISFSELIFQLKKGLFVVNENSCTIGTIKDQNILRLFYEFLLVSILMLAVGHGIVLKCQKVKPISMTQAIPFLFMIGIFLFSGIQQYSRYDYFRTEKHKFSGKSLDEKYSIIFESMYKFVHMNQQLLENNHQGQLISDFDFSKDPAMSAQRLLAYHFYPKVSLRLDNKAPNDIVILFYKKNPLAHIPKDYKIFSSSEDQNYILAIKKASSP